MRNFFFLSVLALIGATLWFVGVNAMNDVKTSSDAPKSSNLIPLELESYPYPVPINESEYFTDEDLELIEKIEQGILRQEYIDSISKFTSHQSYLLRSLSQSEIDRRQEIKNRVMKTVVEVNERTEWNIDPDYVDKIIFCESKYQDTVVNPLGENPAYNPTGVLQIMPGYHDVDPYNVEASTEYFMMKAHNGEVPGLWECHHLID